jgi:rSAM/selenodomain-associated transferase 2
MIPQWDDFLMISVIIPVLNESAHLASTLQSVQTTAQVEVIVVDGGSSDGTVELARSHGVCVLSSPPGRAAQMNLGATIAQGEVLLFLHGDTRLPARYDRHIQTVLAQPGVIAGAFDLAIEGSAFGLRWVEWGVWWRSRLCQLPYGDQALFLTAETFHNLGGFSELPIMEDFKFVQALKQHGTIAIAAAAVLTSSRRWRNLGVFRTTAINQVIVLGYFVGISSTTLAQWYRQLKKI